MDMEDELLTSGKGLPLPEKKNLCWLDTLGSTSVGNSISQATNFSSFI